MNKMGILLMLLCFSSGAMGQDKAPLRVNVDFVDHAQGTKSVIDGQVIVPRGEGVFFHEHTDVFDSQVRPNGQQVHIQIEPTRSALSHITAVEKDVSYIRSIQGDSKNGALVVSPGQYTLGTRMEARWVNGVAVLDVTVREDQPSQKMTYNAHTAWHLPVVRETVLGVVFDPKQPTQTFEFPTPKGLWRVKVQAHEPMSF